eukprot:172600-Pleurochrysis_carterae.AAC.1
MRRRSVCTALPFAHKRERHGDSYTDRRGQDAHARERHGAKAERWEKRRRVARACLARAA